MQIFRRFHLINSFESFSWKWIFGYCCSFPDPGATPDNAKHDEVFLIPSKDAEESQYKSVNLQEYNWVQFQQAADVEDSDSNIELKDFVDAPDDISKVEKASTIAIEIHQHLEKGDELHEDDDGSDMSDDDMKTFGIVYTTFRYEMMANKLTVTFNKVEKIPTKMSGGSTTYQLFVAVLGETGKKLGKWRSIQFPPEKADKEMKYEFDDLSASDIGNTALRLRLYGCERKRRNILLGEIVIGLRNINFTRKEPYKIRLEQRAELKNSSQVAAEIQLAEEKQFAKEMSDQVKINVETIVGDQSELFLGLGYNGVTGRLTVEIVKANYLKNPLKREDKPPNAFVKITICDENDKEIARSKTTLRQNQPHPLFKEKFMFQVHQFQLAEITIMIAVYHRKSQNRKEIIGWFSLGKHNTSDEEKSHWDSMMQAYGEIVCRAHQLQQNSVSRRGLPGAD